MPSAAPKLSFLPLTFETIAILSDIGPAAGKTTLVQTTARILAQSLVGQETTAFGAFWGGEAVGLIALEDSRVMDGITEPLIQDCLFIWQVFVDAQHEGNGFGSAMIDFAKDYAQLIGLSGVALATNDAHRYSPLRFYEKHGFVPTGRRIEDGPDDLIELVWRAGSPPV